MPASHPVCRSCGHWSSSPAFGMDEATGFCEVWEKLTDATHTCDQHVDRDQWQREQQALYEELEGEDGDD